MLVILAPVQASISGLITDFKISKSNWLSTINGTFSGFLESDGSSVEIETTFNYSGREPFIGSYIYAESGKLVRGLLNNCASKKKRYLSCNCSDKYGSGPLKIKFSQNLRSFYGDWASSSSSDERFAWNGSRLIAGNNEIKN